MIPIIEASPDSDLQQLRVDFADGLHYREVYHIGLRVLEAVLLENPDHTDALTTKADILLHQGHKQQALAVLRRANEISPHHPHILNPLLPALLQTANLDEVLAITDSVLDTDAGELNDTCMRARAIAFLLSADHESAQAAAERISGSEGPWATTAIRALAALWDNRAEEALTIACETLNTATSRDWNALLRMIRYDAASRLGRMDKAGMVKESDIHVVSYIGLVEWSEEFGKRYRFSGGWRD